MGAKLVMSKLTRIPLLLLPSLLTVWAFASESKVPTRSPNDPFFSRQWSLSNNGSQPVTIDLDPLNLHVVDQKGTAGVDIGWLEAQPALAGATLSPVTVAVIDSGVDPSHPDLQGRLSPDGWDFIGGSGTLTDDMGHGTHVSGIIGASDNNGIGITGIATSSVKVMPLRVLSNSMVNYGYQNCDESGCRRQLVSDYVADAVNYAVAHQASVINMSMSWPKLIDDSNVRSAIEAAVKSGVLVVVSSGNDKKNRPTYPCSYEGVLCVGAVSNNATMSLYSNFGGQTDILAPGDDILSLYPTETSLITGTPLVPSQALGITGYELLSGTSQASPEVAAVAAVIKSLNPGISANELKARLMASAVSSPTDQALYGRINLDRALGVKPQPLYLPDFKAFGDLILDERDGKNPFISGNLNIQNLWQASSGVTATITINGVASGSASIPTLASGATLSVPWKYTFSSLDDSSLPHMAVHVSDRSGVAKDFALDLSVIRATSSLAGNQTLPIPNLAGGGAPDWIGSNIGQLYSKLSNVISYPSEAGLPRFYQQLSSDANSTTILIYDPTDSTPIHTVVVPGINNLNQVIRLDANRDGKRDWVITGTLLGPSPNPSTSGPPVYLQFYFLNPEYQPLWGSSSAWRLAVDPVYWSNANSANYASPGAWILAGSQSGAKLVPSYITQNILPTPDNYDPLDSRYYNAANHLYYLSPGSTPSADGSIPLVIRAVDSASFRTQYGDVALEQAIPQSPSYESAGHLKLLTALGSGMAAQTQILDLPNVVSPSLQPAPGWNPLSASGVPNVALPNGDLAWLDLYDSQRGSLTWSTSAGTYGTTQDFSYNGQVDPLETMVGAFDFTSSGQFWFFESGFNLVGYRKKSASTTLEMKTLSIDRDTSMGTAPFNELFSPVLVGAAAHPLPGVFVDSTEVDGNRVEVAVWNPTTDQFVKPLRYSLEVPPGCLPLTPVQPTPARNATAFELPLLCQTASGSLQMQVIQPDIGD
jgi:hypothetical protein